MAKINSSQLPHGHLALHVTIQPIMSDQVYFQASKKLKFSERFTVEMATTRSGVKI